MSLHNRDLAVTAGFALLAAVVIASGVEIFMLRLVFGLPLALIVPGYALAAALFPQPTIAPTDRGLYALGLSLCTAILSGFVLNLMPWLDLRPAPWAVLLALITWLGCAIGLVRRQRDGASANNPPTPQVQTGNGLGLSFGQGALLFAAFVVVIGAVGFARSEAQQRPAADVLQLWMLADESGREPAVRVGITSVGPAEGEFVLRVMRGGYTVHEWPLITISAGERWEERLSLAGQQPGAGEFAAQLFAADDLSTPLREVTIWLNR